MGNFQTLCSCSLHYMMKGADDLPDRIPEHASHKDSITSFVSHKVVTTITLAFDRNNEPYYDHRHKHTKKKKKHSKHHHHHHKHHHHHHSKHRKHSKHKNNIKSRPLLADHKNPSPIFSSMNDDDDDKGHTSYIDSISLQPLEQSLTEHLMNKPYVLYREGISTSNDGEKLELNTITTAVMSEMEIDGKSDILNKFELNHIISRVPKKYHIMKWKVLYSLLNDGCSMQTFYKNCENVDDASILILKDESNNIFGAFLDSKWKSEYRHYNGSHNCFVYKFEFEHDEYSLFEYHSTGEKPYYVQSDSNGITIGAGECPAIYIENNLSIGRTTKSDTFKSDPLTPNNIFQIKNVEIWYPVFE